MREILFKAKRIDNGEWVIGHYIPFGLDVDIHYDIVFSKEDYIFDSESQQLIGIDIKTLCQYTGIKDKYGKMIFENDILEFEFEEIGKQKAVVYYNLEYGSFLLNVITDNFQFAKINDGIVIGNKFDNPELLEGEII